MDSATLNAAIDSLFNPNTGAWAAAVLLIAAALWQRCPDAHRILRNTLYFIVFSFLGLKLSDPSALAIGGDNASVIHAAFILCIGAAIIRLLGLFVFRILLAALGMHPPSILEQILVVVAYFIWAMLELHAAGVPLGEIITTSAIATAVLAFAMQDTLGNILGGLALQWDHSLKVGDWVHVGTVEGKIVDIKWRAISVETRDWETVVIPNSVMMKNQFTVLGEKIDQPRQWRRKAWFSVDYSTNPDRVITLTQGAVRDAAIPLVATSPEPKCVLMDIEGSIAKYAMVYWLTDPAVDAPTGSNIRQHILTALQRESLRLGMPKQHFYLTNRDESYREQKQEAALQHAIDAMSQVDLFHSLSGPELESLCHSLENRPYAEHDVIFRQGDIDSRLYVITAGRVAVYICDESGKENYAFSLGPGEFFGETGLMTGEPRAATVRAESMMDCYTLGKEAFEQLLSSREAIIEDISQVMASRNSSLHQARETINQTLSNQAPTHSAHDLLAKARRFLTLAD